MINFRIATEDDLRSSWLTFHQFVAALLVIFCASVSLAAESDLQTDIKYVLKQEGLTGIAWVLVSEDGEAQSGAAGVRDNVSKSVFTTDTRFHVGSITKNLLSVGVLRLVTIGKVDLDAPAELYLPHLQFNNPWRGDNDVTVRHLLDHTSGLDDSRMWQMFSERPTADTPLDDAFPSPESLLKIRSRPGTRYSYSNMGYTLLGMIIESVTKDRYETFLDEYLLSPLDMHNSTFRFTTQEGDNADPTLAWGHVDDGTPYAAHPVFLRPAAQFTTTVADLAIFAKFLLNNGSVEGDVFVDPALMKVRGQPSSTDAANNGLLAGYALGIARRDRHSVTGFCHGGNIIGFAAMLCIFPDERKAYAYGVNTDNETADYGRIDSLLINALGVSQAPIPLSEKPASDVKKWVGRYVLRPNRFKTFEYLDTVFGAVRISGGADSFTMSYLQQGPRQLRALGGYLFSANDRATASHVFFRGDNGQFLISDGFKTYEKVPTAFLVAHWLSVLLALLGLMWLIVAGFVSLARYRMHAFQRPVAWAFAALLLLFVPAPFFLTQSFMALGDLTVASALLAVVTGLLPVGMFMTLVRLGNVAKKSWISRVHSYAAIFVLQWCAVLIYAGLLPLRLWL